MTQFLMLREVADGAARLMGITSDTAMTPKQIADAWVSSRDDLSGPVRLHFADVNSVTTIDAVPVIRRSVTTTKIDPAAAFPDVEIIDVPAAPVV